MTFVKFNSIAVYREKSFWGQAGGQHLDAASSFVVGVDIIGNLAEYQILAPIAAPIVGIMILKMSWKFAWDSLHDLMDRSVDEIELSVIRETLLMTHGVNGMHDLRTPKMGGMIIGDAHIEVEASLTVEAGHDIAVDARRRVLERHRVFNLMAHIDLWSRPDLDHESELRQCSLERAG